MKSGMRVLNIVIVSLLLISCISLVSAGFWSNLFGGGADPDLEGELPASFEVGITMENQAPTIDSWTVPSGGPTSCTTTALSTFTVTISDPDGEGDLVDGGVVTAQFSNGGTNRPAAAVTCTVGATGGDPDIIDFTCPSITMEYYDDGGVGDPWTVTINSTDGTTVATNNVPVAGTQISQGVGHATYPHFVYTSTSIFDLRDDNDPTAPLDTLTWSGVTTTTSNAEAERDLISENCGNVAFTSTDLTAYELTDAATSTNIEQDSFSTVVADNTPCDGGQALLKSGALTVTGSGITVSTGAASTIIFYFCLEDINPDGDPDPIEVGTYTSGASPWDLGMNT